MASFDGVKVINGNNYLDTHANMIVFSKNFYVLTDSGFSAEVNAFSEEVRSLHCVPIIDPFRLYDLVPIQEDIYLGFKKHVIPTFDGT